MGLFKKAKKRIKNIGRGVKQQTVGFVKPLSKGQFKKAFLNRLVGVSNTFTFGTGANSPSGKFALKKLGFNVNSAGRLENLDELKDTDDFEEAQFRQSVLLAQAEKAREEEQKKRTRRGNIRTRPLGVLLQQARQTKSLTGQ